MIFGIECIRGRDAASRYIQLRTRVVVKAVLPKIWNYLYTLWLRRVRGNCGARRISQLSRLFLILTTTPFALIFLKVNSQFCKKKMAKQNIFVILLPIGYPIPHLQSWGLKGGFLELEMFDVDSIRKECLILQYIIFFNCLGGNGLSILKTIPGGGKGLGKQFKVVVIGTFIQRRLLMVFPPLVKST